MSREVDERVVSMQFDNKQFERNVSTTMSTLDKLKQKLHLDGATKGLENIGTATKNVNMSGLSTAVETVRNRFSALEVMGVTALANITNSAVNAGKRMLESLTVAPVKDGFSEYEMTLNAIQTTMAATGKTASEVQEELKKLDEYADKTVYITADMLNNLPKFTNAGVELETATKAMIGIANATALAGGDAGKASIAFYNLGQAIGTGYLTRMDYNSINNAGIATMEWKEQMVEAAIASGTLKKAGDDLYETGGKTFTLQQLFIDGLQHQWATTDVMLKVFGDYGDETTDIGKKSYAAAQDIKTFTMMMDSLKATAGTGWKDTWQLIFGDLDQAKELWTGLTNFLSGIITKMADIRNNFLGGVLNGGSLWESIVGKLDDAGLGGIKKVAETISDATDKVKYFQDIVNKVWRGDYKNAPVRYQLLDEAGYDHRVVQDLVNKGYQYKITIEDIEASHKKFGLTMEKTSESTKNTTKALDHLSDEELKNAGLTEAEIRLYRDLEAESKRTGKSINELADEMSKMDGRQLIIESFGNAGKGLVAIFKALGDAWTDIFPPVSVVRVYNIIKAVNEFSKKLIISKDTSEDLTRTFKGLFAIIDIIATLTSGGLKFAFKVLSAILSYFDLDILEFTGNIGDMLVKFRDWVDSVLDVEKVVHGFLDILVIGIERVKEWYKSFKKTDTYKKISGALSNVVNSIKDCIVAFDAGEAIEYFLDVMSGGVEIVKGWYSTFKNTEVFRIFATAITKVKDAFSGWFDGLKTTDNIPKYIIQGLVNGIKEGVPLVVGALFDLATNIVTAICDVLGIHSPSVVFMTIGGFLIAGLVRGIVTGEHTLWNAIVSIAKSCITWIKDMLTGVSTELQNGEVSIFDMIKSAASKIIEFLKGIDWGAIFAAGTIIGFLAIGFKIAKVLESLTGPLEGFGEVLESTSKVMNSFALKLKADAMMSIAIAIAILAGSILVLSFVDPGRLAAAVVAVGAIVTGLILVIKAISKLDERAAKDVIKFAGSIAAIAGALLLVVFAMKLIGGMEWSDLGKAGAAIGGFAAIIVGLMAATRLLGDKDISNLGSTLIKISGVFLIMAIVVKMVAGMSWEELGKGGAAIAGFGAIIVGLMAATRLLGTGKDIRNLGATLFKVSAAILVMIVVAKLAASMSWDELIRGGAAIIAFGGIIVGLMAATKLLAGRDKDIAKLGGAIFGIAGAMVAMAIVVKLLGGIETERLVKGTLAIAAFGGIIVGLVAATKLVGGNDLAKVGTTLFMMSISIGILAAVAALLSLLKIESLAKGIVAVGLLTGMMAILVHSLKDAKQCTGTLIVLTVAIGLLVASVTMLSFLDPVKLATSTIALSVLMGMMSLLIATTSKLQNTKGTLVTLAGLVGVVVVLTGVVMLLSLVNPAKALPNTIALSILMMALSGVLVIISTLKLNIKDVGTALLGLLGLTVILYALTGALAIMSNIDRAASNALILSGFVTALTLLLYPLSLVGVIIGATGGIAALGLAALLGMTVILYALTGALAIMSCIPQAEINTLLLVSLMTAMTDMLVKVSLVAPLAVLAVGAIAALVALIVAVGALAFAIGELMTKFPFLEDFLDRGIPIMEKLAYGIGSMVGNLVAGFSTAVAASLPTLATSLSLFMTALTPFIVGVKMVDEKVLAGAGILTAAILALTIAEFINGVMSFMSGGALSLPMLGTSLSMFMMNAMPFIVGASMLDEKMMNGVKTLAETILILTASNILNGLTAWFTGGSSLENFGAQIGNLGAGLKSFSEELGAFTEDQLATVTCAANAIKILAQAAETIPNAGGLLADLVGDNELGTFASQFPTLGTGLKGFLTNVGTFSEDQVDTVACAAEAVKTLAAAAKEIPNTGGLLADIVGDNGLDLFAAGFPTLGTGLKGFLTNVGTFSEDQVDTVACAADAVKTLASASKEIPNTGGWLAAIVGDNSLQTFAAGFPLLGTGLAGFLTNVGTFNKDQVDTVTCAADAVKSLALASQSIPNEGGWLAKIVGDNNLGTFASNFPKLGEGLAGFKEQIGTYTDAEVSTVNTAVKAIKALSGLADADLSGANKQIGNFGKKIIAFAEKIGEFVDKMGEVSSSSLGVAMTQVSNIKKMINGLAGIDAKAADNFKNAINSLGKSGVKKFVEAFTSSDSIKKVENAGKDMIDKFIKGMESKEDKLDEASKDMAMSAAKKARSKSAYNEFYDAGKYLVDGFASGISANSYKAEAKAKAMAKAAEKAAKKELEVNSPSKVFRRLGMSIPEGFAMGIDKLAGLVTGSAVAMSDSAIDGVSDTLSYIAKAVDSDLDINPTIRPTLDLSEVRAGAGGISDMLNFGAPVALTANVGAVSMSMSRRNQNGDSEVVSAINKLRKDIGKTGNTSYNINGLSYSGDAELDAAFKTIIRAAKMERRV